MALNEQLSNFCLRNNIISSNQHGFVKNRGVDTALTNLNIQIVDAIESKLIPLGLCIDFSRAFDCVDHYLLLEKLNRYGVRGIPLDFIKSYLSNRKQVVQINNSFSQTGSVSQGVPQGSILGPLLYIIFANDLITFLKDIPNVNMVCYADDTNFLITETSIDRTMATTEEVYTRCLLWSEKNFINLNKEKTVSIIFHRGHNQTPCNNNAYNFSFQNDVKILGVVFDQKLNWETHIHNLCGKLRSACYALRSLKEHCSQKILLTLYYANFHSQIRYGIMNWGSGTDCSRILILQKSALRILFNLPWRHSCRESFKNNKILTVVDTYIYEISCYVYKNLALFSINRSKHNYSTRFKNNLLPAKHSTKFYQRNLYYNGCRIYNNLPDEVQDAPNIFIFKNRLKDFLTQKNCYTLDEFFS